MGSSMVDPYARTLADLEALYGEALAELEIFIGRLMTIDVTYTAVEDTDMNDKTHIVPIGLTEREFQVLEELALAMDLSHERILIQGLRVLQLYWARKVAVDHSCPPKAAPHDAGCQSRFPAFNYCTCAKSAAEIMADVPFKNMPPEERAKLRPANYTMLPARTMGD
jgi:hypothetical protein